MSLFGHSFVGQIGEIGEDRLWARSLQLRGLGDVGVTLVFLDLWTASLPLWLAAVKATGLPAERLVLFGTHTHTGPGRYVGSSFYEFFAGHLQPGNMGFNQGWTDALAAAIARSVQQANERAKPRKVALTRTAVWEASRNRSQPAFKLTTEAALWNTPGYPGETPPKGLTQTQRSIDPRLDSIVVVEDRKAVGIFSFFGCHATALGPKWTTYDRDWPGVAVDLVEKPGIITAAIGLSAAGDATPLCPDDDEARRQGRKLAAHAGQLVADGMNRSATAAAGQQLADDPLAIDVVGGLWEPRLRLPWDMGVPAMAGSEDGRSGLPGWVAHEGMRRRRVNAGDPQSPKIRVLDCLQKFVRDLFKLELLPCHPWHRISLGTHALQTVPGEPTGVAAFRIAQEVHGPGTRTATVAGYSGDYAGYLTSEEEYLSQQYEGASTLFGRKSLEDLIATITDPARYGFLRSFADMAGSLLSAPAATAAITTALARLATEPALLIVPAEDGAPQVVAFWVGSRDSAARIVLDAGEQGRKPEQSEALDWELTAGMHLHFALFGPLGDVNPESIRIEFCNPTQAHIPRGPTRKDHGPRDFRDENFCWPRDEAGVRDEVKAGGKLRVRGSEHSVFRAVYTDHFDPMKGPPPSAAMRNLILDQLLSPSRQPGEIAFAAGHHLGNDPYAHGPAKDPANSIVMQLDAEGYALPELGGISHQSIAGFLATGSAGGSVRHDLTDCISWIRLVDGKGEPRHIARGDRDFDAALVSLGLLGVITEVGFSTAGEYSLPARFDVAMKSEVCSLGQWDVDPFQPGELASFFCRNEYARVLWWPQPMVNKVEVWTGQRVLPPCPSKYKKYRSISVPAQRLANWIYRKILKSPPLKAFYADTRDSDQFPYDSLEQFVASLRDREAVQPPEAVGRDFRSLAERLIRELRPQLGRGGSATPREYLVATIIKLFIRDERHDDLRGLWYQALPHDNQIRDDLMPVLFTEMWIDLNRADEVMRALRDLFERERLAATGTMCFEIYAAKKRTSLLSPSHGCNVVRVDPFVFRVDEDTCGEAVKNFFPKHWNALAPFDFRCHWGKLLSPPDSPTGLEYRLRRFPGIPDFRIVRKRCDPDNIFLTDYWRRHLGI